MSGRCKSCNTILEEWELTTIDPLTKTYTELCYNCMSDNFEDSYFPEQLELNFITEEDLL